ncbi:hypothetical protein ACFQVC_23400 [Streptomyces monticola]|uniref:Uncharacterized protein n=1 Tax=Streptomyces monticola TaxID=2666263 RepID=A0ABW2JPC5_9ACTN
MNANASTGSAYSGGTPHGGAPVLGYPVGPIRAAAAFTSDFEIPGDLPVQRLVDMLETERRSMDVHPGMRHKYTPLRHAPVTGAPQIGGRYLFDTWADVRDYDRFTSQELEFEPGVKFWDRPFFRGVDRRLWRVTGAEDFLPLATSHHVNRFERWTVTGSGTASTADLLARVWPQLRDRARSLGLSSVWLLHQPEERQVGLVTVAARPAGSDAVAGTEEAMARLADGETPGRLLPSELAPAKVFDRTSPILAMWLPRSREAGGAPSAYPTSPPHPLPTIGQNLTVPAGA